MFKQPWRELTEQIFSLASVTTKVEFSLSVNYPIVKPTYTQFRERTIQRASNLVKVQEPYLKKEFTLFNNYYNQCMLSLNQGQDMQLEKIIKRKYEEL